MKARAITLVLLAALVAAVWASRALRLELGSRATRPSSAAPVLGGDDADVALAPPPDPRAYDVKLSPPANHEPQGDNHLFVAKGVLQPGTRESRSFALPHLARVTVLLVGENLRYSFRSPSGETIIPGEPGGYAGYRYLGGVRGLSSFTLGHPESGTWTAMVEATEIGGAVAYAVDVCSDGAAEEVAHLETMLRDSDPCMPFLTKPGDVVFVRTFVSRGGHTIRGLRWDVRALAPAESPVVIPVYDDGHHADGGADDGVSVGAFVVEGPDGIYQLRAAGRSASGADYVVTGTVEVQAPHDLLIADTIAVSPADPRVGEPVTLTVTVVNAGTIDSRDVELEFYLGARKISGQDFDLAAGEAKRIGTTWTPTAVNNYDVQLTINPRDEPYASDFKNNTRTTVVKVR